MEASYTLQRALETRALTSEFSNVLLGDARERRCSRLAGVRAAVCRFIFYQENLRLQFTALLHHKPAQALTDRSKAWSAGSPRGGELALCSGTCAPSQIPTLRQCSRWSVPQSSALALQASSTLTALSACGLRQVEQVGDALKRDEGSEAQLHDWSWCRK